MTSAARFSLRLSLLLLFALLIIFAVLSAVLRLGSPFVSSYKDEMQTWASNYLKTPVEIGSVDFNWGATSPRIVLDKVVLTSALNSDGGDAEGAPQPLKLDKILLDLNLLKSLFVEGWHINEVTIAGADLSLEYLGAQDFRVRGYKFPSRGKKKIASDNEPVNARRSGGNSGLDVMSWLLNANRVGLIDSRVRLLDATRGIDYQIDAINIRAENIGNVHQLRVDLQLPEQLGSKLEVDIDLDSSAGNLRDGAGDFFISGENLKLQNWAELWPQRNIEIIGNSSVKLWGSWQGSRINSARAQLDSREIVLAHLPSIKARVASGHAGIMDVQNLVTDLTWQRIPDGWETRVDQLDFSYKGVDNEIDDTRIALIESELATEADSWTIDSKGKQFDIRILAPLASALQGTVSLGEMPLTLNAIDTRGLVRDWSFQFDGREHLSTGNTTQSVSVGKAFPRISLVADLSDFETNSFQSIPSLRGLNADIDIANNKGTLNIVGESVFFQQEAFYPQPLQLEGITGLVDVSWSKNDFSFSSDDWVISDGGFRSNSQFVVQRLRDQPTRLELRSDFELQDVTTIGAYIPRGKVRKPVVDWFERALVAGSAQNGKVLLAGDLKKFPFAKGDGIFEVAVDVNGGVLDYRKNWPKLTDVKASVAVSGASLKVTTRNALFDGVPLDSATGKIENLFKPVFEMSSVSSADLQRYLDFATEGPMKNLLEPAFGNSSGSGRAKIRVAMTLPLRAKKWREKGEKFSVAGSVDLSSAVLDSERFGVELQELDGRVKFSQNGFNIDALKASFEGQSVTIEGHTSGAGKRRISELNFSSVLNTDNILAKYSVPLTPFTDGKSKWLFNVEIPHVKGFDGNYTRFTATSDLTGTSIGLPEPMTKSSSEKRRIIISSAFDKPGESGTWTVQMPDLASAKIVLDQEGKGMRSMVLGFGQSISSLTNPSSGILLSGKSDRFSFDGWVRAVNTIIEEIPGGDEQVPVMPITANISTQNFLVGLVSEGPALLQANTDDEFINAVVDSSVLAGSIRIPRAHWDKQKAIQARINYADKKLVDDLVAAAEMQEGNSDPLDPRVFPKLNVRVAKLNWGSFNLRDLSFRTEPSKTGMKVTTIGFANKNAVLSGDGYWQWRDPQGLNPSFDQQQISNLVLQMRSDNIGQTMVDMGLGDSVAKGRGTVDITLDWPSPLYAPDLENITGEVSLALRKGRILSVEPGAARVFGLFALQSLPRRLTLDFTDLVQDGLDFDRISGKVNLLKGEAVSQLVQLEGPVGVVDVTGTTNFIDQTYDQKITVLPRISGALPIIGLISGGATAGIGALLAGPLLKALGIDIDKIGLMKYRLTGSWDEPVFK